MKTENNKIIAEFLGATANKGGEYEMYGIIQSIDDGEKEKHYFFGSEMLFDTDWNWLMEVVEKIETLTDINSNGCFMVLESIGFNAKFIFDDGTRILKDSKGETKIEAVYNACLEFINWYNQQKN